MSTKSTDMAKAKFAEENSITKEPFYVPIGNEVEIFRQAATARLPILLKGATGTGKTRFVEYMAWHLRDIFADGSGAGGKKANVPLVTVSCHEDLSSSDLVGRFLFDSGGTRWMDGPLTRAVRYGGICYLDEFVEARKDVTVVIHSLTDHRRLLTIDKLAEVVEASKNFIMVTSYNPGYQSMQKDMKHSTRQRFIAIELGFPPPDVEAGIIQSESGCDADLAERLAGMGEKIRHLKGHGLEEVVSTRTLIYAATLMRAGISPMEACRPTVIWGLTDDATAQSALAEIVSTVFE